jgi:NAD(P)H dehydrogenase (quinone)
MTIVTIVYHSKQGHTKTLATEAAKGAQSVAGTTVNIISVPSSSEALGQNKNADQIDWEILDQSDAIILGCPTYLGNVTGEFKLYFMDASGDAYLNQKWKNKIAAGFTNSHSASGDKLTVLLQMAIFAAQHGMIWVGQAEKRSGSTPEDINRLGSYMGAMAQCDPSLGEMLPPLGDRQTVFNLGKRVAEITKKFQQ